MERTPIVARILIVEDHVLVRRLLWQILTDARHEVVGEAELGAGAVARFVDLTPGLVMLGLGPAGSDELRTLRAMLAIDPSLPVIVCAGSGELQNAREAVRAGAHGFIVKPFSRDIVLSAVRHTLRGATALGTVTELRPQSR
jgi:two-component system, chemotaxis family, chemotaxis protein CheY